MCILKIILLLIFTLIASSSRVPATAAAAATDRKEIEQHHHRLLQPSSSPSSSAYLKSWFEICQKVLPVARCKLCQMTATIKSQPSLISCGSQKMKSHPRSQKMDRIQNKNPSNEKKGFRRFINPTRMRFAVFDVTRKMAVGRSLDSSSSSSGAEHVFGRGHKTALELNTSKNQKKRQFKRNVQLIRPVKDVIQRERFRGHSLGFEKGQRSTKVRGQRSNQIEALDDYDKEKVEQELFGEMKRKLIDGEEKTDEWMKKHLMESFFRKRKSTSKSILRNSSNFLSGLQSTIDEDNSETNLQQQRDGIWNSKLDRGVEGQGSGFKGQTSEENGFRSESLRVPYEIRTSRDQRQTKERSDTVPHRWSVFFIG